MEEHDKLIIIIISDFIFNFTKKKHKVNNSLDSKTNIYIYIY